jgi:hypothetical protein
VNASDVDASVRQQEKEEHEAVAEDLKRLAIIKEFPSSSETRVISYGLYGSKPKYTVGAIRNAELAKIYFPGWTPRFYVTSDVPVDIREKLVELGSELREIPSGMGYASGMFWRFLVAADSTVDRYIVRDTDSRLNSRERLAVEDWIESKYPTHIMRDHVNHCIVMNGGMWGGTKETAPTMQGKVDAWAARDEYMVSDEW